MGKEAYKSEVDLFTTFSSNKNVEEKYRRKIRSTVFLHQNHSDLAAGLEMIGFRVIVASQKNTIKNTLAAVKASKDEIDAYIVDSIVMENGELQAPFSLIGYIRIYDPYTPILALSYDTNPESVQSAFRYGATSYLSRPQTLELIAAVVEGLAANGTVINEAIEQIDTDRGLNPINEMIRMSSSLYLDYAGRRLAFLDEDGEFTFSEVLPDNIVSVLHCLTLNRDKRLSAAAIGRLLGNISAGMNYQEERKVVDVVSRNLSTIKRLFAKYDKYKTITLSSIRRYGTTMSVHEPDPEAMKRYAMEKEKKPVTNRTAVRAGFNLVSLMDENSEVKTKQDVLDEATLEEML